MLFKFIADTTSDDWTRVNLPPRLPKMTENSCVCFSFIDLLRWLVVWPVEVGCIAILSSSHRFTLISPGVHCVATIWQTEEWGRKVTSLVELGKQERRRLTVWTFFRVTHLRRHTRCFSCLPEISTWLEQQKWSCVHWCTIGAKQESRLIHYIWQRRWCGTFCPHTHIALGKF